MNAGLKRTIIGCGITLALVAGGSIAFAANQTTAPQNAFQSFLDDVAGRLNVTPAALQSAIKGAEVDRVQAAVQAGKITQAQAGKIEARINSGKLRGPFAFHGRRRPMFGLLRRAAGYLGVTAQTLRTDVRNGQSLAQITAQTPGKSVAGLESALLAPIQSHLNQAVQAHKITQAQATQRLTRIQTFIGRMINRTFGSKTVPGTAGTATPPNSGTNTGTGQS